MRSGDNVGRLLGTSSAIAQVLQRVEAVASTDATVLVSGESGVGKELVARRIHQLSARRDGPLVTVNCASIPRDLFESEFFGHVRGAFTGASRDRTGRVEAADGGTLFLDEVGEIPTELQGKLLRVLQHLTFERVGEERTRRSNVRFIAATNRDLRQEVAHGRFRRDFYYRLSVFPIDVPPLRAHPEDIALLARHFLAKTAAAAGRGRPRLTKAHIRHLEAYDWPGNVRELQNVIEQASILSGDGPLRFDGALPTSALSFSARALQPTDRYAQRGFFTADEFRQLERQNVIGALEATRWKVSGADGGAALLGMKPSTLASRLKALAISRPEPDSLYARLGGHHGLATFAHDLFGRVLADPQLSRFWEHRSNIGVLREEQLLIAYLSAATGGPGHYVGREMKTAHRALGITDEDWAVFQVQLSASLDACSVGETEREEVQAFVNTLRGEIVSS